MDKINWYPGHMKKTRELIQSNMKMVDLVVEVIDSRIPVASRNPILPELIGSKPEIIVLNKKDLSDPAETKAWIRALSSKTVTVIPCDCESGEGTRKLLEELDRANENRNSTKKWDRPLRMMIVGIPNVGKSSLINRLTKRRAAKTGNKPGVTRGKQWLTLENGMQLLDTPGILWPNIKDQEQGRHLAYCGAIKDEIYDISELCLDFIRFMLAEHRDELYARYKLEAPDGADTADTDEDDSIWGADESESLCTDGITPISENGEYTPLGAMEAIARNRGFIMPGKRIDYERCARTVLDEFRAGKIGRITLEHAEL
ncbi:MAG: ribosome biogenesis GTPase YlqF [Eubacterium sp.]|nr:ribosome biogenesis GTPase YlqF [Eubacterium sp.]